MGWKSASSVERYARLAESHPEEAVKGTVGLPQLCPNDDETPDTGGSEKPCDDGGFDGWAIADLNCGLPPCEEGTLPLS